MEASQLKLEVNIALIPDPSLLERLARASALVARFHPAIVQLDGTDARLSTAPHLTLYQAAFPYDNLPTVTERLATIAKEERPYQLASTGLAYNAAEGSLEVGKEVTDGLVALQNKVITATNPLREGLLIERDPGGNVVAGVACAEGILGQNIWRTGYAEVGDPRKGGLFRPHDTLNWLVPHTALSTDTEEWRLREIELGGTYQALGIFIMGQYGTCPQRLAAFDLSA